MPEYPSRRNGIIHDHPEDFGSHTGFCRGAFLEAAYHLHDQAARTEGHPGGRAAWLAYLDALEERGQDGTAVVASG